MLAHQQLHDNKKLRITASQMADITLIAFFALPLLQRVFHAILSVIGLGAYGAPLGRVAVYLLLLITIMLNPRRYFKLDFILIWLSVVCFFALSLLIHPEYEYWYARDYYGVWDHVLIPSEGLYAYLFVRLMDDPDRFLKNMRRAGWLMYLNFFYQIFTSLRRGYWFGVTGDTNAAEFTYSVAFGYNVLFFLLFFFYSALLYKRRSDILATLIGVGLILSYGSRGPILCIAIFVLLMVVKTLRENKISRRKTVGMIAAVLLLFAFFVFYEQIIALIALLLLRLHISSRFITKLLNGTITSDSGRSDIWQAALEMIRDNPFGYGAMGSRPVISSIVIAGYPHSIILEFLIDFGVFVGGGLLLFLAVRAFTILFRKENEWGGVFVPLFAAACSLLMSLTFWSTPAFWACLAVGVNQYSQKRARRRSRRIRNLQLATSEKEREL